VSAARARRDNLQRSAEELTAQLDEARLFLDEALAGSAEGLPEQFAQLEELLAGRS